MRLPSLRIGRFTAKLPIIQGGMAIRISTGRLAGAVARAGGIGIIATPAMSYDELKQEIALARKMADGGIFGINMMFAARDFPWMVQTALEEEVPIIFFGAGFSRDIFKTAVRYRSAIVPVVSSARLALTSVRCGADAVIVEGKEAGGHLGTDRPLMDLLPEVREAVGPNFPIIGAGGIYDGREIVKAFKKGASGVQIATRFVLSEECNAAPAFKKLYQGASERDVVLISSPVGLTGRALLTPFTEKILNKTAPKPKECDFCLKTCSLEYCIFLALREAQKGNIEEGIVFSGEYVWKIKDRTIKPAAEIIAELAQEAETD